jgi:hypothetical protein
MLNWFAPAASAGAMAWIIAPARVSIGIIYLLGISRQADDSRTARFPDLPPDELILLAASGRDGRRAGKGLAAGGAYLLTL